MLLALGAAEELRHGDSEQPPLHIPERDVDRGEREGGDAAPVPVPPRTLPALPPQLDVVERVAPDDELGADPLDHRLGRAAGIRPRRDGLAPSDRAVLGLDPAERQMADGAVVVRLRVADRDRRHAADRGQTRTSSIPSARASTGISTSSLPRASALWCVAPDAIQRAPASKAEPESKRNMPFGPPTVS